MGIILYVTCPYIDCLEGYWKLSASLRNYLPDSDLVTTTTASYKTCMILCLMTDGCCFISYIASSSECVRHRKMLNYTPQTSSSVWNLMKDDGCPCGWYRVQTTCLIFPNVYLTRDESLVYCQRMDATLAEIINDEKYQFIVGIAKVKTEITDLWLGGSDISNEGTWLWNSGLPITGFTKWSSSAPDNYGKNTNNADCLYMGSWIDFYWDDCGCAEIKSPLCEKPSL
ncbi:perlucin-like [Ylistrum balloti]|uniref:perlucin-like n=1 Tax=Ylistrum balloti TaxID=509963 RepID=UPI0029059CB6|nr:perlucin-like [Ylistrum balloti]